MMKGIFKKILSSAIAMSICLSFMTINVVHATTPQPAYLLAFDNATDCAANLSMLKAGAKGGYPNEVSYNSTVGALYANASASATWNARYLGIVATNNTKHKYVKIVWKTANNVNITIPSQPQMGFAEADKWVDCSSVSYDGWMVSTGTFGDDVASYAESRFRFTYAYGSNINNSIYVKYIAFFDNEADMLAYDRSVLGASIDGVACEIDNVNHNITLDLPVETTQSPVFTLSEGSSIVLADSDVNYDYVVNYTVTDCTGEEIEYKLVVNYPQVPENSVIYSFETQALYNANNGYVRADGNGNGISQRFSGKAYDATNEAMRMISDNDYNEGRTFSITCNSDAYKYVKVKYKFQRNNGGNLSESETQRIQIVNTSSATNEVTYADDNAARGQWAEKIFPIPEIANPLWLNMVLVSKTTKFTSTTYIKYVGLFQSYEDAVNYGKSKEKVSLEKSSGGVKLTAMTDVDSVKIYVAYFNEGETELTLVNVANGSYTKGDTETITVSSGGKVFVWDDNNMPLAHAYKLE